MIVNWSQSNIILAIVGMIGLLSTLTVVTYSFQRNHTGDGKYQ